MVHKIWYDQADEILYLEFTNNFLRSDVDPILEKVKELLHEKTRRQMIIKMSSTYKVENRETREESNKGLHKLKIQQIAFVGGSAANRMIAKVLIKTGMMKISGDFFKNNDDAINWLKSKR